MFPVFNEEQLFLTLIVCADARLTAIQRQYYPVAGSDFPDLYPEIVFALFLECGESKQRPQYYQMHCERISCPSVVGTMTSISNSALKARTSLSQDEISGPNRVSQSPYAFDSRWLGPGSSGRSKVDSELSPWVPYLPRKTMVHLRQEEVEDAALDENSGMLYLVRIPLLMGALNDDFGAAQSTIAIAPVMPTLRCRDVADFCNDETTASHRLELFPTKVFSPGQRRSRVFTFHLAIIMCSSWATERLFPNMGKYCLHRCVACTSLTPLRWWPAVTWRGAHLTADVLGEIVSLLPRVCVFASHDSRTMRRDSNFLARFGFRGGGHTVHQ